MNKPLFPTRISVRVHEMPEDAPQTLTGTWVEHDGDPIDGATYIREVELPELRENKRLAESPHYEALTHVLAMAYRQAAKGKGKDRHANNAAFTEQPMMQISRAVGSGFPIGQAIKKLQEAARLHDRGEHQRAQAELLGAIVYCAGAHILIDA